MMRADRSPRHPLTRRSHPRPGIDVPASRGTAPHGTTQHHGSTRHHGTIARTEHLKGLT